ncbi:MAG: hypothetical protein LBN95_06535 [Prevotellaceae bacterium]|jgi:hypothetical protein|nr:hypothetical protein [Prevotellaceae bacterium]
MKHIICQTAEFLFWIDEVNFVNEIPEPADFAAWKKIESKEPIVYSSDISTDEKGTLNTEKVEITADKEKVDAVLFNRYGFHTILRLTDSAGKVFYVGKKPYPCKMEFSGDRTDFKISFSAQSPI